MSGIYTIPSQNALQSTLDAELSAGGTSMTLADDWSSYFTGVSATNPAILVIDRQDANGTDTPSKREYVEVTNVSGATFTIGTRGKNGSTDQVHSVGARVECVTDVETLRSVKSTYETEHNADGTHDVSGMITGGSVLDEDDMASDSDTAVPTQQSVKAYVDAKKTLTSSDDHIVLTAGTSKLVKIAVLRQNNTTNSYVNNSIILTGYNSKVGDGSTFKTASITVTFGVTFSTAPILLVQPMGVWGGSYGSSQNEENGFAPIITSISTTAYTLKMADIAGATTNSGKNYYFTWIAIGQLN